MTAIPFNMARISYQQIITMSAKHAVKLPKPVTDAASKAERISQAARSMGNPNDLAPAVLAALREERDPVCDPEVQRLVTLARILDGGGIEAYVDDALGAELRQTCTKQADGIVKAWAEFVERAVTDLTEAHEVLGDVDLADTAGVLERGGNAAQAWAAATKANQLVEEARSVWNSLGTFTGQAPLQPANQMLCLLPDLDLDGYRALRLGDQQPRDAWTLLRAGHRPRLATFAEYHQTARGNAAELQAEVQADDDFRDTGRRDDDHRVTDDRRAVVT